MLKADDARSTGAVHVPPAAGAPLPAAPAIPSCRDLPNAIATLARDAGPDAELLALHREFLAYNGILEAWNAGRVSWEEGGAAQDQWWECIDSMIDMHPATPAGLRAKAETALLASEMAGGHGGRDEDLVRAALLDMVGRAEA